MKKFFLILFLTFGILPTVAATPTADRLNCRAFLTYGSTIGTQRILLDYTESTATTGFQAFVVPLELSASATDQSVNLASYVDTATFIAVRDRNNTGVLVGRTTGTSARLQVAANGFIIFKNGAATPPTLYFDNVSTTDKAFIEIVVLGSSS
jgi:hypothetical protein